MVCSGKGKQLKDHWKCPKEQRKELHLNTSHNSPPSIIFCAWKCLGHSIGHTADVMLERVAALTLAYRTTSHVTRFRGIHSVYPHHSPLEQFLTPKTTEVRVLDSWFKQKVCPYSCPTSLPILQALCMMWKGRELLEVIQCRCCRICHWLT